MLDRLERESDGVTEIFTFPEWRALLNLELDATTFMPAITDRRVVMLPLNGARLRVFDAVLVLGADAEHLPSQPQEMLFFSNAVRAELGLATRASRQRQQLRDLTELLCAHDEVVLCWQSHKDGEPNPVSPWIERLQLRLARGNLPALSQHRLPLPSRGLLARPLACRHRWHRTCCRKNCRPVPTTVLSLARISFLPCACCAWRSWMNCPICRKSAITAAGCIRF